jgi:hypothetical protein
VLIAERTFSCATIVAVSPMARVAPPKLPVPARRNVADAAIFALPPTCSDAALVLMM